MRQDGKPDLWLFASATFLMLNFVSQAAAFPFQAICAVYGVVKADIRYMPMLYLAFIDKSYFTRSSVVGIIKYHVGIPLSVLNIFTITVFLVTIAGFLRNWYDKKTWQFVPAWISCAIPAVLMARQGYVDGVASNWQTPLITMMVPAFYLWGIRVGRTWDLGFRYFIKRMAIIFVIQSALELPNLYMPGCQFQNNIIPLCFGLALFAMRSSAIWKALGATGICLCFANVIFGGYVREVDIHGLAEETAIVSTFTRLAIVIFGIGIAYFCGSVLKGRSVKIVPWAGLLFCTIVFSYAVLRANVKNQSDVIEIGRASSLLDRFEMKLVGDRGAVWHHSFTTELFARPLFIKRFKDMEVIDRLGNIVTKMVPHNQVLTLICRQGWWLGLVMVGFLWWMHTRTFDQCARMPTDRVVVYALLAPSAAIFMAVGLTGQYVFTQMWHVSSMASLTFPGIIYGLVNERLRFNHLRLIGRQ